MAWVGCMGYEPSIVNTVGFLFTIVIYKMVHRTGVVELTEIEGEAKSWIAMNGWKE
jgi:hypothetical protein